METAQHKTINRPATVQPAAVPLKTVQRKALVTPLSSRIQTAPKVSSPHDPAEKEAEVTAKKIMRMAVPEGSIAYITGSGGGVFRQIKPEEKDKKLQTKLQSPYITRFANSGIFTQQKKEEEKIQRKAEDQPQVAPNVTVDIQKSMAGGSPLPLNVRRFMEPRFRANFSPVKVHTSDKAAKLNRQLNARAFTMGNHLFFGKEQFKPESREGKELIAHELTHTIQQGSSTQEKVAVNQMNDFHATEPRTTSDTLFILTQSNESIQRLPSWDDIASGAESIYERATETGARALNWMQETANEAIDWISTSAGQVALGAANALASLYGGSVVIRGNCIVITIPNIPLFPSFQRTLAEMSPRGFYVPIVSGGMMIGPIPVGGTFGVLAYAQLSAEAAVGPGELRGLLIELCPLSGSYMGTAQLYIAAAVAPRLTLFGGLAAAVGTIVPSTPPIPIIAIIQGGLRGTGTGWLIGALRDTVIISYSGGRLSFTNITDLMGGVLLQGDVDLFAALRLYDKIICQYIHPLGHWETGRALKLTIPIHAALGGGSGSASLGPVT